MQVVVLIAGVVDPKHRLGALGLRPDGAAAEEAGLPRRLSPFDEAALEIGLKLRDAHPAVRVTAVLLGGPESDALVRSVSALRPHRTLRFGEAAPSLWDPAAALRTLAAAVAATAAVAPDLVLVGREFSDADDGLLPAALAEAEGWRFAGLAHAVVLEDGAFIVRRLRGGREEALHGTPPLLVSVTNERGNRLRRPLMKNVALAKREKVEWVAASAAPTGAASVKLAAAAPAAPARRSGSSRVLTGPVEAQIAELAAYLAPWRAG